MSPELQTQPISKEKINRPKIEIDPITGRVNLNISAGPQPDPPPFDIDGYFNEWNKTQPIETIAVNHEGFTSSLYPFVEPWMAIGYNTMASLNRGAASLFTHLDLIGDYIEKSGLGKKEGLFEKLAQISSGNADYWKQRVDKVGISFLNEMISEAIGGFVPGVTQFILDVGSAFTFPYMAGAAEAVKKGEQPFIGGMVQAGKTATLSAIFKMMGPLKKYLQAPTMGTIFGLQEMEVAPEGEKTRGFAKGAGIGIGYSLTSPGGRLGLNEIYENAKPILEQARAMTEIGGKVLTSERGAIGKEPSGPPKEGVKKEMKEPQAKPRKFLKTVEEASETAPEIKERLREIQEEDPQDYYVQPNKESLEKANKRIDIKGVDKTVDYVFSDAELNAEKGATFISLMERFQKEGDYDRAIQMVEAYDFQLREAGRFIQAASIWNKLTPSGFIRWADKQMDAVKSKYSWIDTLFGNKPESFTLSKEEKQTIFEKMTEINKMPEGIEKTDATLQMIDIVAKKVPPSISEMFDAYRYQNMLSSPRTHFRNIGENIFNTFITRPMDIGLKGGIDYIKSSFTGKDRESYVSDVPVYMKTAINSIPNAVEAFMTSWKLESGAEIGKPEVGLEVKGEFQRARAKQIPSILTMVPRFMEACDKFNTALIGAGEFAINKQKGMSDTEAYQKAKEVADKYLYRDKLDPNDPDISYPSKVLSSLGKMINDSRKLPVLGDLSKWYIPFIRTPINKGIQMIERSPLGLARSEFNQETMGKIMAGSIFTAAGTMFAMQGQTTWSPPTDEKEKEWFYASGRKPFSVKIGDEWIPIWYLGPYALSFGIPMAVKHYTVDRKQAMTQDSIEQLLAIAQGTAQFIGSQTSTQNIGALFSALQGDIGFNFSSQTAFSAGQIIPATSLVRFINTILDPVYRKPKGFFEQIEKDLPFLSQQLEARQTPLLEESKREVHNYFLPYDVGTTKEVYESNLPMIRYESRQKYLENKIKTLTEKVGKGEITIEDSMKELDKILGGNPKSFEMLGQELLKQEKK